MEEWKEYRLGDVVEMQKGFAFKSTDYSSQGIKIIKVSNLNKKQFDDDNCVFISPILIEYYSRYILKEDDIIISTVGSWPTNPESVVGKICLIPKEINNSLLNQNAVRLRAKDGFYQKFLYYLLSDSSFSSYIAGTAQGSANQASITLGDIRSFTFYSPDTKGQKVIASILSSLDDKIELNRKINANLEAQAQALFKSWFVDFEPFKDQPFVESELGMIPEGWRVGTVNDVCCFESGFAFKSTIYKQEGEYRLITIKNVQDGYLDVNGSVCLDELPAKMPQYCILRIGDILLSLTGNVGRCCFVDEEKLLLNQRVAKLKPRIKNNWGYIYTLFRNPSFKDRVVSIARGTAQANLSPIETSNMIIIIPTDKVLEDFSTIVDESYRLMVNNMIESRRLASLRDTLLPRLMSGELKVNEVI